MSKINWIMSFNRPFFSFNSNLTPTIVCLSVCLSVSIIEIYPQINHISNQEHHQSLIGDDWWCSLELQYRWETSHFRQLHASWCSWLLIRLISGYISFQSRSDSRVSNVRLFVRPFVMPFKLSHQSTFSSLNFFTVKHCFAAILKEAFCTHTHTPYPH